MSGRKRLFAELFGEDDDDSTEPSVGPTIRENIGGISGLVHAAHLFTDEELSDLLDSVESTLDPPHHNQSMHFGNLPAWGDRVVNKLLEANIFPESILARNPLFNQMIVNSYEPGEGIVPHVDLLRFEDGVVGLSFLSSCVMTFRRASEEAKTQGYSRSFSSGDDEQHVKVLLVPGDIYMFHGEARYNWTHEISKVHSDDVDRSIFNAEAVLSEDQTAVSLPRTRRVSVTFRKLVDSAGKEG